ncbi:MFS transporter [Streptomyces lincolnensis]|uniref:MFS transporter n=1 Tax=Streptomyces lincolnensis TaxID=1915 RepID=UPI0008318284|nr:MFS transporter [Streptomyces lincolnensis]QMV09359.1 MFS transporter [Streptomyces lincolnensis]
MITQALSESRSRGPLSGLLPAIPPVARVLVATCLAFAAVGILNPVLPRFVDEDLGRGPAEIGVATGAYALATLVVRPPSGFWVDRVGHRVVFLAGAAGLLLTQWLYPLCPSYTWMLVDRLGVGAALALVFAAAPAWTVALVPQTRGRWALGSVGVSTALGQALAAPLGDQLYRLGGHPLVAWGAAGLAAAAGLVAATVRPGARRPAQNDGSGTTSGRLGWWHDGVRPALLPGCSLMLSYFGYSALLAFSVLSLEERGVSGGAIVLTAVAVSVVVIRLATGRHVDRMRPSVILPAAGAVEAAGLLLLGHSSALWTAALAGVLIGAGCSQMFPALGAEVLEHAERSGRQASIAVFGSFLQLGLALGGAVLGSLVTLFGYPGMYAVGAVCALVGAFGASARLELRRRTRSPGGTS